MAALTAEQLLAGSSATHELEIPAELMNGHGDPGQNGSESASQVVVRPLTVRDLQRISRATQNDDSLSAALMIQQALVEPELQTEQISQLPAGLAHFLVEQINQLSGINAPDDELAEMVQAPLARACFILAREFGWTPEEVSGMTIGQILLYLEMLHVDGAAQ